ncbi:YbhN family protein [Peredibacter starrii]|uniref:YbhN family protein n=1 Tax=Peredibacter starrii TaxID=28202 RepID=A0AAX4HQE0_9BACT|nr:YbhN family protein [Peredibacter starrii]WPU65154.1 YbhN family protein [Peredibacter starrii]
MKKIFFLILMMLVLTMLGDKISGTIYQYQGHSYTQSFHLIKDNVLFILFVNLLLYAFDMLRMKLIGKIFKLNFSWEECFGGVALNLLFGWVSPMAILGAPAMAWYYYKKGHPLVESFSVSFVRSFAIILTSAITTITIYALNIQGPIQNVLLQEKVFQVLTGIAIYFAGLIILSYLPFKFIKEVKFLDKLTGQIRTLLTNGKVLMLPIMLITLVMNFLLVSFIMYEGYRYYSVPNFLLGQVMLFLSYMLLMPTPGASGLAEVGAPLIFSGEIPLNDMISIVTAMRVSTIGLQVTLGVVFMLFVFKQSLTIEEIKQFKKKSK